MQDEQMSNKIRPALKAKDSGFVFYQAVNLIPVANRLNFVSTGFRFNA